MSAVILWPPCTCGFGIREKSDAVCSFLAYFCAVLRFSDPPYAPLYNAYMRENRANKHSRGGGVLPYMGYIGMCGPKGYGFSAVLVINWVSILAILPPFWS